MTEKEKSCNKKMCKYLCEWMQRLVTLSLICLLPTFVSSISFLVFAITMPIIVILSAVITELTINKPQTLKLLGCGN
jgi:membrane-anchored protein YejM (alkaline phosphatase superfamily)